MNIEKYDILMINGSEKTGINTVVRDSIMNFALSVPVGKIKYIVIDEFEYLSHNAQASLRNIMEGSQDRTRFILTANKTHKILPAIKSRCQTFVFKSLDRELYDARVIDILIREGVDIGSCGEEIVTHVDKCYPDMRKTLNSLQQHFVDGKILGLREAQNNDEYAKVLQDCRSQATFKQAREHVSKNFNENDYVDFYKFLYKNSGEFDDEMSAIIIIAEGLKNHAIAADPEINLMGTMAKLLRNA
jgi:DNA polymerase III delta prime subunit